MAKKRTTKTLRTNLLQMTIPGPAYPIELMTKQVSEKSLVILPDEAVEA